MLKDKKEKKALELKRKKEDAEFEAKYQAKIEMRNVEKYINQIDGSIEKLFDKAIDAKKKGLDKTFQQIATQIKIMRARKSQAENFKFQYDLMLEMKDINAASVSFLNSMQTVMQGMGNITFSGEELRAAKDTFDKSMDGLSNQSDLLDNALQMFDGVSLNDNQSAVNMTNIDISDIEAEVNGRLNVKQNVQEETNRGASSDSQLDEIKRKLNTY